MNTWISISISVITSSFVAALITWWANSRLKKLEFKQLYYEMILKKRLGAYQKLDLLLLNFSMIGKSADDENYHQVLGDQRFIDFFKEAIELRYHSKYLSVLSFELMDQLSQMLEDVREEFKYADATHIQSYCASKFSPLENVRKLLEKEQVRLLYILDDISSFVKLRENE